jgi:hypothetical protein
MNIAEGGNVFKGAEGVPVTKRINQTDIKPTVVWLEQLTGLDLRGESDSNGVPEKWLGSTGRKPDSGDLDIEIDANTVNKDQLAGQLTQWAQSHGFDPKDWVRKTGSIVHFKTPINGNPKNGYVQTDFTFLAKPAWSRFVLSADPTSAYKGATRNVLINSMAKAMGYKLNQVAGIADRATNELISDDPDKVAKMLLNKNATRKDLSSVESILAALKNDRNRDAKLADFKAHMEREGTPLQENSSEPLYTEVNFLARLRDRVVNQGMSVIIEATDPANVGGKAKGIEHLEDLVFRKGTRGIKEALAIVDAVSQDTKTTTIKWDGKPAIIFGRNEQGQFILTDVAGFGAKGYNGLFTSPRALAAQMAQRDENARAKGNMATRTAELVPIYDTLWPMLEASLPKNFRGFIHGDLLYMEQPPLIAGNYVFKPNTIEYRIPANSDVGKRIGNSEVGVAIHTYYPEVGAPKQALTQAEFSKLKKVPGLLLIEPVTAKEPVKAESTHVKDLKKLVRDYGSAIDGLFNPAELRALQITDLPSLCVDYINSLVGDENVVSFNPNTLLPGFGVFLQNKVSPRKFANIVEYLKSPRSNSDGITAAFSAFIMLHNVKEDLQNKLDLQHPGQEGWVFATPAGTAKAVNRFQFSRANRAQNNPDLIQPKV